LTYTEWIAPLPYNALYPVDNEPAAFYVARIQASGKAAWVHSPYSPGWWVGRVAIAVTGDGLENIETWLTLCRYLSALLLATLIVILRLDSPATMLIQRSGSGVCRNFHVADRMPYMHGYCAYYSFVITLGSPLVTIGYWQLKQRSIVPTALASYGLLDPK